MRGDTSIKKYKDMKTLKENTATFLNEVKSVLDLATWDIQACNPKANYDDCKKATSYLDKQRWSIKKIKPLLEENWDVIVERIKEARKDNLVYFTEEEKAEIAAKTIANELAFARIAPYSWSNRFDRHGDNAWYIDESVSFSI